MKKVITKAQMQEIEKLAENHSEAIIAAMADMYRRGLVKGMVIGCVAAIGGIVIGGVVRYIKTKKRVTSEEES